MAPRASPFTIASPRASNEGKVKKPFRQFMVRSSGGRAWGVRLATSSTFHTFSDAHTAVPPWPM